VANLIETQFIKTKRMITKLTEHGDRPWNLLLISVSLLVIVLIIGVVLLLWRDSALARTSLGWDFLKPVANARWDPASGKMQAWPFIYGTLITALIAIIIAFPVSIGISIFLAELCPNWLRIPLGWMIELLAAIPSVVYGIWGIFVFLPQVIAPLGNFLGNTLGKIPFLQILFTGPIPQSGMSRLAAGIVLAIMIIPTIAAVSRDVFLAIPKEQREASYALGSTQWETIWKVLIPYATSGILGASILGLGRALGETMAVTMVIGNSLEASSSLLRPGYSMASVIVNQFQDTVSALHSDALIEIALILFLITLILNLVARLLVWQTSRKFNKG
jgi:phosphate transport system permease protein